jgi:hypothetical protein
MILARTHSLIKHPGRDATRRIVGELHIYQIPLAASGTEHFQRHLEEGMEWITKFKQTKVSSVECAAGC